VQEAFPALSAPRLDVFAAPTAVVEDRERLPLVKHKASRGL